MSDAADSYGEGPLTEFLSAINGETETVISAAREAARERLWVSFVLAMAQGGWNARRSVAHADEMLKAFDERGGMATKPAFGK